MSMATQDHASRSSRQAGSATMRCLWAGLPRLLVYILLTVVAIISLFPLYWMFNTAFTPTSSSVKLPPDFIPVNATLNNFSGVIKAAGQGKLVLFGADQPIPMPSFLIWIINTALIALVSTAVHLLFDSMAGYAFAKRKFPGSNLFFWMILAALMIPGQVTLVPLYLFVNRLRLVTQPYLAVILPGLADVAGIFMLKQFIQTLPRELEEAARIDGASEWGIYRRIIVPLSAPAMAVTAIFAFQRYWNAFVWPLIVLPRSDYYTLQVGLSFIHTSEFGLNYGYLLAGASMAAIPMIAFFFAFQRYFMQGLRIGALKG